jgi:hypothetical protein
MKESAARFPSGEMALAISPCRIDACAVFFRRNGVSHFSTQDWCIGFFAQS